MPNRYFTILLLLLCGCTVNPSILLEKRAYSAGLERNSLIENGFELVTYSRIKLNKAHSETIAETINDDSKIHTLYVYLEGDGHPWVQGKLPAANPTSNSLLALELMLQDPNPSVYLNRPCYALEPMPANCHYTLWTEARYSELVVDTLNRALNTLKSYTGAASFTLIGHSGGGTLAILLAARRNDINTIITIAANIDHQAWTESNKYLPLQSSLNAVDVLPLGSRIKQRHFIGANDQVITPTQSTAALEHDSNTEIIKIKGFDHHCCWKKDWGKRLRQINKQ